jgi:carbon storage regulator
MLVLSRKPGEKIHIGAGITITVIEIAGNKIRLGIDAPVDRGLKASSFAA